MSFPLDCTCFLVIWWRHSVMWQVECYQLASKVQSSRCDDPFKLSPHDLLQNFPSIFIVRLFYFLLQHSNGMMSSLNEEMSAIRPPLFLSHSFSQIGFIYLMAWSGRESGCWPSVLTRRALKHSMLHTDKFFFLFICLLLRFNAENWVISSS